MTTNANTSITIDQMGTGETKLFTLKLERLVRGKIKNVIDADAGLLEGTTSVLLHRKNVPQPYTALRLARALGVDYEWLVNEDDKSLDPPFNAAPLNLQSVRSRELLIELARRYHVFADTACGLLGILESRDELEVMGDDKATVNCIDETAARVWRGLWENGPAKHEFNMVDWALAADIMELARAMTALAGFGDMDQYVGLYVATLPPEKQNFEADELRYAALRGRLEKLRKSHPGFDSIGRYMTSKDQTLAKPDAIARHIAGACLAYLLTRPSLLSNAAYKDLRESLRKVGQIDAKGKPVYYLGDDIAGDIGIPPKLRAQHKNA